MTVGIVGLGLIGGSLAKAYKRYEGIRVLAYDTDEVILNFAILSEDVDGKLNTENVSDCDLVLLATYPAAAEAYLRKMASHIPATTVVMDCLGTKRQICETGFRMADTYGFVFAGGHPMAGSHNSGFKYARGDLFDGAPMVIVPPQTRDAALLEKLKELLRPAGFGSFTFTTAEEHDRLIAFTSQLAHVVSNAYIKSPNAAVHKGFSAGSYKDLTRVAWLNPQMWAELFLENKDNLTVELDALITNLSMYKEAIEAGDAKRLTELLREGKERKQRIDGPDF